jgi:molybdopterin molybdotransferase
MHSTIGLEDFVRVRLEALADGTLLAQPVFGKSSMLSTMARADGLIVVPLESEGLLKGETVEVIEV